MALREERFEALAFTYRGSLTIGRLFMLLVVSVVGIEQVADFPDLVLQMKSPYLGIIQFRLFGSKSAKNKQRHAEDNHSPLSFSRRAFILTSD